MSSLPRCVVSLGVPARRVGAIALLAWGLGAGLAACGGGSAAGEPTPSAQASAAHVEPGTVPADQVPSIETSRRGLASDAEPMLDAVDDTDTGTGNADTRDTAAS